MTRYRTIVTDLSEQLSLSAYFERRPVRVLDAAEADASHCYHGCGRPPSFRVTAGAAARDYCEACLAVVLDGWTPVPYDEFPEGF